MEHVIKCYENYREEDRLTTNNARKIEYITNIKAIKSILPREAKILDCGAGTGEYAIELSKSGYEVTAMDITPRHVDIMKKRIKEGSLNMSAQLGNATDLSEFEDETFDVVLCMGPYYHLPDIKLREKCINEVKRVTKRSGLVIIAYIGRFFVYNYIGLQSRKYLTSELSKKIYETGEMVSTDTDCFWTDCYFAKPEEIELTLTKHNLKIVDHLASDGIAPMIGGKVDELNEEEFRCWCDNH